MATLSLELLEALDDCLHAGLDRTEIFEIYPGFKIAFRTLTGEEEIDCRTAAAEYRGPAYIYTYKTKVLSYVLCELNGISINPGDTLRMPKERTDEFGRVEEVLADVPVNTHLEKIILSWSRGLIDVCFKLWSKHQEDQLYAYISPLALNDLFTVDEKLLSKEFEQILNENDAVSNEMTEQEIIIATQNATPGTDLVKIGAKAVKQAEPHIDFSDRG